MIYKFREIWKTVVIDGVEHPRYKVSNLGRVKCLDWNRTGKERIISQCSVGIGYIGVCIDGKFKLLHRVVAETFIPNPQNKPCIDHIDTNKQNNVVTNLRFCTHHENNQNPLTIKHMSENAGKSCLGKFGAEHSRSIQIVQLSLDGQFIKKWSCAMEVERELGIDHRLLPPCCKGKRRSTKGYRWMYYSDWVRKPKKSVKEIAPLF